MRPTFWADVWTLRSSTAPCPKATRALFAKSPSLRNAAVPLASDTSSKPVTATPAVPLNPSSASVEAAAAPGMACVSANFFTFTAPACTSTGPSTAPCAPSAYTPPATVAPDASSIETEPLYTPCSLPA